MFIVLTSYVKSEEYPLTDPINDPWEKSNRQVFRYNQAADQYFLLPLAKGYDFITPYFMQRAATNFFAHSSEPYTLMNDVLQLKMVSFYRGIFRFGVNTFIGLAGIIDVSSYMGIPRHNEDFGQTLGAWGVGAGPYMEVPLLGPSTSRDTVPRIIEFFYAPSIDLIELNDTERWTITFVRLLANRNDLRQTEQLIIGDRYTFIRDAYLQNRRYQVLDGILDWEEEFQLEDVPEEDLEELESLDDL